MADPYASMLGLELDDEQKMRELAQQLRGQRGAADMFAISTVPQIAEGAASEQARVADQVEQVGGLRRALAQRQAQQEEGRLDRENRGELQRLRLAEQAEQNRLQRAADAAQAEADRLAEVQKVETLAGYGMKPAAGAVKNYNEATNLLHQIDDIEATQGAFTEDQINRADAPLTEVGIRLLENYAPEGLSRVAEEQAYEGDPGILNWHAQGRRLTSRLSQLASGMAVTGYEMADRDKWSPWAPGISFDERQRRLANIKDDLRTQQMTLQQTHKGYLETPYWQVEEARAEQETAAAKENLREGKDPEGKEIDVYTTDVATLKGMVEGVPVDQLTTQQKAARLELLRRVKQAEEEERAEQLKNARASAMGPGGRVMP